MDDSKRLSLDQIRAFLSGAEPVEFAARGRAEVYAWVERNLVHYEYARQGKADKGLLRRYLGKMTGLSRAQVTRLIRSYLETGRVKAVEYKRHRFAARYTKADVDLLAYVDKAHGNLSGPPTRRIPGARVRSLRTGGLRAAGADQFGADLPAARHGGLPEAQRRL